MLAVVMLGVLSAAFAEEAGWKLNMRALAVVDYFQTTQFVFCTPGIEEKNRCLQGASHFETALYLGAETEAAIWLIDRLPKKHRPLASALATLFRALPVLGNSKLGAKQNYSVYVPLLSGKF
jgi:hypothetical protein